jgi:hypothetical protein
VCKELARKVNSPTEADWLAMKKVCRYLAGARNWRRRIALNMLEDSSGESAGEWPRCALTCYTDAAWASGPGFKSTSGGVLYWNGAPLTGWSKTQSTTSLSSCEAELGDAGVAALASFV